MQLLGSAVQASATYRANISYDFQGNGGGNYTFDFAVSNNSDGADTGTLVYFFIDSDADPTS